MVLIDEWESGQIHKSAPRWLRCHTVDGLMDGNRRPREAEPEEEEEEKMDQNGIIGVCFEWWGD